MRRTCSSWRRLTGAVEAFSAEAADPALDVRVRVRRLQRRADHLHLLAVENGIEGAAELRVSIVDQEAWPMAMVGEVHQQVPRLLHHPGAIGVADAGDVLDSAGEREE